ncbi:hypothetical protein V2J95_13515 [Pseudomonas alliivorans]|nr:hypothetical protein [Pseudomonas alliivorans]
MTSIAMILPRSIAFSLLLLTAQVIHAQDLSGNTAQGIRNDGGDDILLQGFHWNSG